MHYYGMANAPVKWYFECSTKLGDSSRKLYSILISNPYYSLIGIVVGGEQQELKSI